ncbi:branched-chain amino acid ABC transporter permease [Donghicola tyrosinivorans]|uniref:Branched-chain amino acid transport system permease protein n=1 Tax=Donghicola tyrosinivorans TaxID=1652492 RepID=A0A2T0WTL7_9RHOB|nr:branched-chain amino acid ABC transporter permease [Donghicola tyrosinivorans]PRY90043.1 branched-chain amino acid transport system permease protein [Donghicola tyrosinivorans]
MNESIKTTALFALVALLIIGTGLFQSWNAALGILNMGLISAVMALGVNLQWGFAGLFNVGVMGFVALGGLATVLISMPPVPEAWAAGGLRIWAALGLGAATLAIVIMVRKKMAEGLPRAALTAVLLIGGFVLYRSMFDPARDAIEAVNPALQGYLGGMNLPVLLAWPAGGLLAAGAAWVIGKTALGLRSDYLAIATLGIAEIIIAIMKNEDWLARGVKNINGLPRPLPYEIDLQADPAFVERAASFGLDPVTASTLYVKAGYGLLFAAVLLVILFLMQRSLHSPWGRMMRAIRDNEVAARAMGKDVTKRHLQIFILGSAICGIAGAMMTTLDGQLTPSSYQPLRFTFLIWVMVIVGGSGNNFGAILGGFIIWFLWVQVEPFGRWLMELITSGMEPGSTLRDHLLASAAHMRLLSMGLIMLLMLRFSPRGLLPEK